MKHVSVVALLLSFCFAVQAETNSVELRIQQQGNPSPTSNIAVNPNDAIALSADVWGVGGQCTIPGGCAQNKSASDFIWSSDDRPNATCDPYNASECNAETDFQVNPGGVTFKVPEGSSQPITISARERAGDLMGNTTLSFSAPVVQEVLPTPPSQVVVLQRDGRWVVIDGVSYWVPRPYRADWVPYQHGHWAYIANDGWTWVSYDPWGAYTDHYGIWRLHGSYGWVWLPFEHPVYHPSTVTFFFSAGHIGWSPYYSGWPGGYRAGEHQGFRDGYHSGMVASQAPHGATVVVEHNFYANNIYKAQLSKDAVPSIYRAAVTSRSFGAQPGGLNPVGSRTWVQSRVKSNPFPQTSARILKEPGATFRTPVPFHPTPAGYPRSQFNFSPQPIRGIQRGRPSPGMKIPGGFRRP